MGRDAGLHLLGDEHHTTVSPDGRPVVGWKEGSQGEGSLVNLNGWALLRTVVWKIIDGARRALYDQITIVENPGVYVVCRLVRPDGTQYALVLQTRMTGDRLLPHANREYVARLDRDELWANLVRGLGRDRWEIPAGLLKQNADVEVEVAVLEAARAQVKIEAGYRIANLRLIGRGNANPVFFAHSQWIVLADIEEEGEAEPDARHVIAGRRLFTEDEIGRLIRAGELEDLRTIACLALCGAALNISGVP